MSNVKKAKILVVDDEAIIREYLAAHLSEWGHTVLAAENGRQALLLAAQEQPDLVLLDIQMPEMDGIETCKRLRSVPSTRHTRIIILTALDTRDRLEETIDIGADDFLGKPINLAELRVRVSSMLKVKDMSDEVNRLAAYIETMRTLRGQPADEDPSKKP